MRSLQTRQKPILELFDKIRFDNGDACAVCTLYSPYNLFYIVIVPITRGSFLVLPRPTFLQESHNNPTSPRSGSLNTTVSLAMAFGALKSQENTSERHRGATFINPKATALFNNSHPTATSSPVQQNSQWGPGGVSTVVFGCIASILGMLAIWATIWLGHRQFRPNSMPHPHSLLSGLTQSN